MTVRSKLTLWYAVVLFASVLACSFLLYQEWVIDPLREQQRGSEEEHLVGRADGMDDLIQSVLWSTLPAGVLGLGGGWLLMRKTLAPIAALTKALERVNESNLNVRLPRTGNGDELDRLTEVFNSMTARLADSFDRIREFTLRASHELKTPLTIIRGEIETSLADGGMAEKHRESLLDELDEIDRLAKIVDGLTTLTKADAGLMQLKREPVRLDELVRETFADGQVLARPCHVKIRLGECEEALVHGDNYRLRQVLLNLTDNAVKYNVQGGLVVLSLQVSGKFAELTVTNTGPGIPKELLPRLFDPFFRGDTAHNRDVDGCGLGLAIALRIVTAHGGSLIITSEPGKTTVAKLQLPLLNSFSASSA